LLSLSSFKNALARLSIIGYEKLNDNADTQSQKQYESTESNRRVKEIISKRQEENKAQER